ncbi:MAG: hypothetical protein JWM28_710 [Chitinophagaceae bacterium]|nr:hypothetical protein [Chitinophagaceae bacterium]
MKDEEEFKIELFKGNVNLKNQPSWMKLIVLILVMLFVITVLLIIGPKSAIILQLFRVRAP